MTEPVCAMCSGVLKLSPDDTFCGEVCQQRWHAHYWRRSKPKQVWPERKGFGYEPPCDT